MPPARCFRMSQELKSPPELLNRSEVRCRYWECHFHIGCSFWNQIWSSCHFSTAASEIEFFWATHLWSYGELIMILSNLHKCLMHILSQLAFATIKLTGLQNILCLRIPTMFKRCFLSTTSAFTLPRKALKQTKS